MIQISGMPPQQMESWDAGSVEKKIIQQMLDAPVLYSYRTRSELLFEINVRKNIIESAEKMNEQKIEFTTFKGARCNPEYWHLTEQGGFLLKPGIRPSAAIMDIYVNSPLYGFECATASVIILYHAAIKSIGKRVFDVMFQDLYLYSWHTDSDLGLHTFYANHLIPGDVVYFKNPEFNPGTPWYRGENAVALTGGKFFGHGFGIRDDEKMIQKLNKHRKQGSTQSAYLTNLVTRPSFNRLAELSAAQNGRTVRRVPYTVIHHNKCSIAFIQYLTYYKKMITG
ncbi:protein-glutamine gamma-glutamyltransferase [Bacillus marinisedimentorum]|uniref:protein-glutamine gamma-glutamyltransferase n=1 Tax=Bacillus marinisedimentorum TaxID=1821260 RepID=UPI0007E0D478|nr:protein-glutamine gamma-glutamyltransferase [Bacillus marinisedimentorum]